MSLHNALAYSLPGCPGIAWQKKTHYKYFKNPDTYRKFYKIHVKMSRCYTIPLADIMQRKLVQWLHAHGESKAGVWFEKYWTSERGNWTKDHDGVGGTNNNNGTERRWGEAKKFICSNSCSTAGNVSA
jgi:hypothetical protein